MPKKNKVSAPQVILRFKRTQCPHRLIALSLTILALLPAGCERDKPEQPETRTSRKPEVLTTFYPTTWFTQVIGGDHVSVSCLCPCDADPAGWRPNDETIARFQQADLIVINGASFERWISRVSLPQSRIVDTAKPLSGELITIKDTTIHSHGPTGEHSHAGIDGHTWLDPINAIAQAARIRDALIKLAPENRTAFESGFATLEGHLRTLDRRFKALTPRLAGVSLLCSHPSYNYVARRYGWDIANFLLEPDAPPNANTPILMKRAVEGGTIPILLWESAPSADVAENLARDVGVQNVVFSPCEMLCPDEVSAGADFLSIMNGNIERLDHVVGMTERPAPVP